VQDSRCHRPCRTVHHCTANEPSIAHAVRSIEWSAV
jgi:hypothetical protein